MLAPLIPCAPLARQRIVSILALLSLLLGSVNFAAPMHASAAAAQWLPADAPGWPSFPAPILLADGHLLVAGGQTTSYISKDSALYDPATDAWTRTNDLTTVRLSASLTALPDGGVLAAGGIIASGQFGTTSVDRFDPASKTWHTAAPMHHDRYNHSATILDDGRLIVVGGSIYGASPSNPRKVLDTVEIYDPVADRWQEAAPLSTPRTMPHARLLPDGTLLIISGDNKLPGASEAQTAERYDPRKDRWTPVALPKQAHGNFTMTVLQDGRVLLLGGAADTGGAETYDPATDTWTVVASPATIRSGHAATLLGNGEVLVTGGQVAGGKATDTTEHYDPRTNSWRADAPMLGVRQRHSAILVLDMIYVLGGGDGAERYQIETTDSRCFAETGRCTQGRFLAYWQEHGGLALNGYPLSAPFAERLEDGKIYLVQYFERVRMEYHPENAAPNNVLLGQFGRRIHSVDPAVPQQSGAAYFAATGHNLSGEFLSYWETNGGLDQFGYPLTEVITETLEDGQRYRVQYFERARFEYHPENAPPFDVLLGQFGREILAGR
jgi:hypothetical protein